MADLNYIDRIKKIREQNILRRAGKPLIFPEDKMIEAIKENKVPTQMQHCILKVMPQMQGTEKEKFISAFNICAATFIKHGYQQNNSTTLTGKGMKNNLRHRREVDGSSKNSKYKSIQDKLWRAEVVRKDSDDRKKHQEEYEHWKQKEEQKKQAKNMISARTTTRKNPKDDK